MKVFKSIVLPAIILAVVIFGLVAALIVLDPGKGSGNPEAQPLRPKVTETPSPTPTMTPEPTKEPTKAPTPTPTETPTPEPKHYLGDLEEIQSGTLVNEEELDKEHMDTYFKAYPISDKLFERIYGDDKSYKTYCDVPRESLSYIKVLYRGFDNQIYVGELMVNADVAGEIVDIFKILYENDYQIERMQLVDDFGADDLVSIDNNNTSAFNYRNVTGGDTPSNHAYGRAIDINPINNPYITYDEEGNPTWEDRDAELYLDRDAEDAKERHMINYNDLCYQLFHERGWFWGGDWANPKDYQHFEKV